MKSTSPSQSGSLFPTSSRLSCHVRSDVSWRQTDVRPQVTWRNWRTYGKYNSLKICLISLQILCTFLLASPLKTGHVTPPTFFIFFIPKFYLTEKPDEKWQMMCDKDLQEDDIQKIHTTDLRNWPIRNYSSVQFLWQTLSGNTLVVGTKRIPSVSSEAKHTDTGLLQSSVTWPLR